MNRVLQEPASGLGPSHSVPCPGSPACRSPRILVSLLLTLTAIATPRVVARASELGSYAAVESGAMEATHEEGPQSLKQRTRITIETNAPAEPATNSPPPGEKSFQFKAEWHGWDGLRVNVSQRTTLADPLAAIRENLAGTNAPRVFRLEELKMGGKLGAKLAVDAATYITDDEFQDFDSGAELRRARLYAKGDCLLILPVSYELEVGYIPREFYIENSFLSFKDIPWIGELRAGQFQPPMGLELITSSRDIYFMEPAAPMHALAPGTSAGIQIGQPVLDRRATWRLGLFTDGVGTDFGDASKDYGRAIARFTTLPLWQPADDGGNKLLHLGISANVLYSGSSTMRYRSRPESHLAPYVVDTGEMEADGGLVAGVEVAWVHGPWSMQGEYVHSWVRNADGDHSRFSGAYGSVGWFLTGDSRPYDRSEGAFARVTPRHNLDFGKGGWGAWEVVARASYVDLDDGHIHGGRLAMVMGGVNWYLHSHLKWRFDYGFGHVSDRAPDGNLNIFQTRVEVDL